jgi:hypothetical protein
VVDDSIATTAIAYSPSCVIDTLESIILNLSINLFEKLTFGAPFEVLDIFIS